MTTNKIFIIGLNKTATTSIHRLFEKNGFKSVHWCIKNMEKYKDNRLEELVENNLKNNKKPLDNFLEKNYQVFSDIENLTLNFDLLDKYYPNSLFIYNYRSLTSWILSRLNYNNGTYLNHWKKYYKSNLSDDEIIQEWVKTFNNHQKKVYEYFKNKNNIIYYDIENETMIDFINKLPFSLKYQEEIKLKVTNSDKKYWIYKDGKYKKI